MVTRLPIEKVNWMDEIDLATFLSGQIDRRGKWIAPQYLLESRRYATLVMRDRNRR